jgi:hypothetical protein
MRFLKSGNRMDTHKPWYQSAAVQGILVILVSRLLARCNLSAVIPTDMGIELVNDGLEALTVAGAAWIAKGRFFSPPTSLTLTKAAADVANATTKLEGTSNAQPVVTLTAQPLPPAPPAAPAPDGSPGTPAPKP